ncbi:hypothetical protein HHK36_023958 [Tetracentron sinense]|uniref:Cytochrome b561 and DOMON domain-containing protein n=1 Tax=Tetracentron sinense TaxID=13715 RepID=A0A835D6B8_TETSI|nr:hypothetical protein HHK36_023958 [Tetracentron sinense]
MAKFLGPVLFCYVLVSLFLSSSAQSCGNYAFSSNKVFSSCNDLPVLNSFLHWNYNTTSGTVQIAYRQTGVTSFQWIAWAINPNATGMEGSQALVAYQSSEGNLTAYTSPVTNYSTKLEKGDLSFAVSDLSAVFANNEMIIFATVELPNNTTTVNQAWQEGPLDGKTPGTHARSGANLISMGTLDFLSGQTAATGGGNSKARKRNVSGSISAKPLEVHGVLNAISWGTLMPLGALIARYLRVFKSADPAWFYIHVTCQSSAYIIGVAGWATGLKLGSDSSGIHYDAHRNIGIALFCLGTLQKDHKSRFYWNIYHHSIGYLVIILSIVNIFKGLDILDPEKKWKKAYIAILVILSFKVVLLEAYTWYIVLKRKRSTGSEKTLYPINGVYEYGARPRVV